MNSWDLVQSALDELAEAFSVVTKIGTELEQARFKAETMLLMVRQDELIEELYINQQT